MSTGAKRSGAGPQAKETLLAGTYSVARMGLYNGEGFPLNQRNRPNLAAENEPGSARRAALYLRVSTGRQAEHDLSIPDQRTQLRSWCRSHGYEVVAEFVEAGASTVDDRRPVFQKMVERACDGEHAFGFIVVHSYSRFFREATSIRWKSTPCA